MQVTANKNCLKIRKKGLLGVQKLLYELEMQGFDSRWRAWHSFSSCMCAAENTGQKCRGGCPKADLHTRQTNKTSQVLWSWAEAGVGLPGWPLRMGFRTLFDWAVCTVLDGASQGWHLSWGVYMGTGCVALQVCVFVCTYIHTQRIQMDWHGKSSPYTPS